MPSRSGIGKLKGAHYKGVGWYGNGELGDVIISSNTSIDVAEDDGQLITQYKSLTINSGRTLQPAHRCNGWILLVQNDLIINGHLSMDKKAPCLNDNELAHLQERHIALVRGNTVGGNAGSAGQGLRCRYNNDFHSSYSSSVVNSGGTPGRGFHLGGGFGPGGGSSYGQRLYHKGGSSEPRPSKGSLPSTVATSYNDILNRGTSEGGFYDGVCLPGINGSGNAVANKAYASYAYGIGGKGPGGSGAGWDRNGGTFSANYFGVSGKNGDAYGGGALFIFVGGKLQIGTNGSITADGGNGADSLVASKSDSDGDIVYISGGPGGGAGGGMIFIIHGTTSPTYTQGQIHANGGKGGLSGRISGRQYAADGSDGSAGPVTIAPLLNYFQH